MQFYPGDWLSEPSLRMVSHEAKGVLKPNKRGE